MESPARAAHRKAMGEDLPPQLWVMSERWVLTPSGARLVTAEEPSAAGEHPRRPAQHWRLSETGPDGRVRSEDYVLVSRLRDTSGRDAGGWRDSRGSSLSDDVWDPGRPGVTMTLIKEAPTPPVEHPLPWRWVLTSRAEDADDLDSLQDANGKNLIQWTNYECLAVSDAYVRAVTERAKALDEALRWTLSHLDDLVDFRDLESEQRMKAAAVRKLLAEIDAAKARGE